MFDSRKWKTYCQIWKLSLNDYMFRSNSYIPGAKAGRSKWRTDLHVHLSGLGLHATVLLSCTTTPYYYILEYFTGPSYDENSCVFLYRLSAGANVFTERTVPARLLERCKLTLSRTPEHSSLERLIRPSTGEGSIVGRLCGPVACFG